MRSRELRVPVDDEVRHVAREPAGRDRVHVDPVPRPLPREVARERDHAALRRVVRERVHDLGRRAVQPGDRGDVDDLAAALLDHRAARGLRAEEDAGQVHVDDLLPALERHVLRRGAPHRAGVVDEDVDAAELVHDARRPSRSPSPGRVTSHGSASARVGISRPPPRSARPCARRARARRPPPRGPAPSGGRCRCRRR